VSLGLKNYSNRSKGEGRFFLYFYILWKASKISGLKEWAELVASQLTQITTNANKIK
jgi:hypothetical protein